MNRGQRPKIIEIRSVFSAVGAYLQDVSWGIRSVVNSCVTAIPYLFVVGDLRKEVTEEYPDPISSRTIDDLPRRSRGLPVNDVDRCTGCKDCARICPSQCIRIETEPGADAAKTWVSIFDIDYSRCIFCGLCAEVCLPSSLTHTKKYEAAVYRLSDSVASFGKGSITEEQREKWATMRKLSGEDEAET